jgi:hypothetical protein
MSIIRRPIRRSVVSFLLLIAAVLASAFSQLSAGPAAAASRLARPARSAPSHSYDGVGFDTCSAPSAAAMRAWHRDSRYRAVGIYIGGINRACGYGNLSPAWVRTVSRDGWQLVPLYVGRQAPCVRQKGVARMNPATVRSQAAAAANDAVHRATRLGLRPRTAVYFDLEGYTHGDRQCTDAVLKYLAEWTEVLHAHGYVSGVYSSADSGIRDLAGVAVAHATGLPDALWIARWDKSASPTHDPSLPDLAWSPHSRIKQFNGGRREMHGGVTIEIDQDWIDGPVGVL